MKSYAARVAPILANRLSEEKNMSLWSMSTIADEIARKLGKKKELFDSLWYYLDILPKGWRHGWVTSEGSSDRLYCIFREEPSTSPVQTLLLGSNQRTV